MWVRTIFLKKRSSKAKLLNVHAGLYASFLFLFSIHIDPLHACHMRQTVPRSPFWWSIGLHVITDSPKMRTSLNSAQSDIAHQYGTSKIILMMTSGELGQ